jgi:site-specific recombinase XerD
MRRRTGRGQLRWNAATGLRLTNETEELDADGEEQKVKALSRTELAALLDESPDEWRLLFTLLALTGLRISEAIALTWATSTSASGKSVFAEGSSRARWRLQRASSVGGTSGSPPASLMRCGKRARLPAGTA